MRKAMKKTTARILAVAVAVMMVFGTATVFADDGMAATSNDKLIKGIESFEGHENAGAPQSAADMDTTKAAAQPGVKAVKGKATKDAGDPTIAKGINYSTDKPNVDVYLVQGTGTQNFEFYSVKANATGTLWVDALSADDSEGPMEVYVQKTSPTNPPSGTAAFNPVGNYISSLSPGYYVERLGGIDVTAGQTVWIDVSSDYAGRLAVQPYVIPYSTRTLPAGKAMLASGVKGNTYSQAMFKIEPSKSGYIDVGLKANEVKTTNAKVTLLNKNKKVVSSTLPFTTGSKTKYVVFGVKKGQTYYLKVTNCNVVASGIYAYAIQYKVTAGKIRSNTKKSKSVTLKRKGKYVKTTLPANGKKGSNWYKFKVTKKRATQIRVDATNVKSGSLKITVYCGKKKVASTSVTKGKINTFRITYSTTYGKAKKGKYYVKISKTAKTNGQYRIKYLK